MSIDLSAADVNVYRRVFLRPISPGRIWELHRAATTANESAAIGAAPNL